jgi:hypothetical protein
MHQNPKKTRNTPKNRLRRILDPATAGSRKINVSLIWNKSILPKIACFTRKIHTGHEAGEFGAIRHFSPGTP